MGFDNLLLFVMFVTLCLINEYGSSTLTQLKSKPLNITFIYFLYIILWYFILSTPLYKHRLHIICYQIR